MKRSLTFIFLFATALHSFGLNAHDGIFLLQNDSTKIFKRYHSTLDNAKNTGLSETLILKANHDYDYKIKVGMVKRERRGIWAIVNDRLILNDNDTIKLISILETSDKVLPFKQYHFEISGLNNEEIGYRLKINFRVGKNVVIDSSKREIDIMGRNIKSFDISSVIPLGSFFPRKHSNSFKIVINSDKTFFKTNWKINGPKLNLSSKTLIGPYYLEEF